MTQARLHLLAYRLRRYHWQDASLQRWLGFVLLLIAASAAIGWLPGRWLTVAGCIVLLLLLTIGIWLSARRYHIRFHRQDLPPPAPMTLSSETTFRITATGLFEVEGKEQSFTELTALFRSFATRERIVYAHVLRSRFLWLARWPERDVGVWYAFFTPDAIEEIEVGKVVFGAHPARPALHIRIRDEKRVRDLYMGFEDEGSRSKVWADLLADTSSS